MGPSELIQEPVENPLLHICACNLRQLVLGSLGCHPWSSGGILGKQWPHFPKISWTITDDGCC